MAIYVLLQDTENNFYCIAAGHIAILNKGSIVISSLSNRVLVLDNERVKSIKILSDEGAVAGIMAKLLEKAIHTKQGGE
ncbi:MAG: hypothetical protein QW734_08545 [Candidatus Bathyarchaeia archaeon]